MAATACAHEQLAGTSFYKFQRRKLENTKTEFIMKTISAVAIAAIIGSVAMHGADARLGRRLSPFGNGQSGRGPSPFDPSKGWWDEADQSVGSPFGNGQSGRGPSPFDPSQGWWDEADESVGSPLCYKPPYYSCNHQGVPYN